MKRNLGFTQSEFEDKSTEAINRFFSPEFRNRLTGILQFNSLEIEVVERIVDKLINELEERLKNRKVKIKLSPEARNCLARNGYNPQLGARPIQRLIDKEVTEKLSKEILFGKLSSGGTIDISLKNDELSFDFID